MGYTRHPRWFRPRSRARGTWRGWVLFWCCLSFLVWAVGCMSGAFRPPANARYAVTVMAVTGYCNCGKCCSWRRTWFGLGGPVVTAGPRKGQPKDVGVTACGTEARHGTVAADTFRYPFGTVVYVPGYGYGRVEDTGGALKGDRLDLWFDNHDAAMQWGRQRKLVKIWLPSAAR